MTQFSNNLKLKRRELKLTQQKCADMIGVKVRTYQAWEEGRSEPSMIHQSKLCEVLHIDDLYLFITTLRNEN